LFALTVAVFTVSAAITVALLALPPPGTCDVCTGCAPPHPGPTPLGSAFALNTPVAGGGPSNRTYQIGVVPSSGVTWGSLHIFLTDSRGNGLAPMPNWVVVARSASDLPDSEIATYNLSTSQWTGDDSALIVSGQWIILELGSTNLAGHGDRLVLIYPAYCPGVMARTIATLP